MIARVLCTLLACLGFLAGLLVAQRLAPEWSAPRPSSRNRRDVPTRTRPPRAAAEPSPNPSRTDGRSDAIRSRRTKAPKARPKKKRP